MFDDLFILGVPPAEKIVRTVVRVRGHRGAAAPGREPLLAQLNNFDLVVVLLLSNVVQNAIIGADDSLLGGLLGRSCSSP